VGPPISGATFHKDPNSTSAWNGLIYGAKKWIMYPPDVVPPGDDPRPISISLPSLLTFFLQGIYASEDGWEVTTPVSPIEWFYNYYEHRNMATSGVSDVFFRVFN